MREKQEELRQRESDFRRQSGLKNAHFAKRKAALVHPIQEAEKHVGYLQNTLAIQEKHAAQGMLERQTVEKNRDELSPVPSGADRQTA